MRSLNGSKLFAAKFIGAAASIFVIVPSAVLFADEPPKKEEHKKAAKSKSERPAKAERPAKTEAPAARTSERPARTETPASTTPRTRSTESTPSPRTTTIAPDRTRDSRPAPADNRGGFQGSDRTRPSNLGSNRTQPAVVRGSSGRVESYRTNNGSEAHFRPDGRVQTIRANGMVITHGAGNSSRIVVERADRTVIVTNGSGHGYVQRPFVYGRTEMVTRTYYVRGVVYNSYYRPYVYHGISLNVYVPVRYYTPAFYGFVYTPWVTPVRYSWGYYRDPWYGYYGGYFAPAPYYPTASLWLTDYMISARLADAYADQANRAAQAQAYRDAQGGPPALSPAVKQEIAMEVQRQLDMERAESQAMSRNNMPDPSASGLPRLLGDGLSHVFIVSYNLDVNDSEGRPCSLTRGDVIKLTAPPAPNAESAYLQVAASKGGDCRQGSNVIVALTDLQDTLNQMRESINQGMGELQNNSGKNGMPALPRGATAPAVTASFVQSAPPPDPQVATELQQQVQEAQKVEQDVVGQARQEDSSIAAPPAFSNNAPPAPTAPVTIGLDMTIAQVVDSMGSPKQIVDLGPKQIYVYQNMKIVFMNGKVSDVQ